MHAANMGAKVINISVTACLPAADPMSSAHWVPPSGTPPPSTPSSSPPPATRRGQLRAEPVVRSAERLHPQGLGSGQDGVHALVVLRLRAVRRRRRQFGRSAGQESRRAMGGGRRAGIGIMGLSPQTGRPVNAYPPSRPGEPNTRSGGAASRGLRQWRGGARAREYQGNLRAPGHQPDSADRAQPAAGRRQPGGL